jgi:hypothetical protein
MVKAKPKRAAGEGARIDIPASECELESSTGLPKKIKDRHGDRQGRLTLLEFAGFAVSPGGAKSTIWESVCDCGKVINVYVGKGPRRPKSCNCLYLDVMLQHGASCDDAGPHLRKAYSAWAHQTHACYSLTSPNYPSVGARGIKVCDRWLNDFSAFLEDVGLPPTLEHVLSRIDFDKDFEPDNVQWFEKKEQQRRIGRHNGKLQKEREKPEIPFKDELILLVKEHPNLSVAKYCKLFAEMTGKQISESQMSRRFKRLGLKSKGKSTRSVNKS